MEPSLPLKVIHVDDDIESLNYLQPMLEEIYGIEYLKNFTSPVKALDYIKNNDVDVVFLDVEMPEEDGLWLAKQMDDTRTKIIFVTGHTGYAIQAFEVCALNYIIKPVIQRKLVTVVEQAIKDRDNRDFLQTQQVMAFQHYIDPAERPKTIFVTTASSISIVKLDEIVYFVASKNYTDVVVYNGERLTCSKTIKTFEVALIHDADFRRISRSHLLNINYLKAVVKDQKLGTIFIEMKNGDKLATACRTKEEAMRLLYRN